jgi:hypothetical protein
VDMVTTFTVFHVGAVAALFFFSWPAFFHALAFYWVSLSLGVGIGSPAVDSLFLRITEMD